MDFGTELALYTNAYFLAIDAACIGSGRDDVREDFEESMAIVMGGIDELVPGFSTQAHAMLRMKTSRAVTAEKPAEKVNVKLEYTLAVPLPYDLDHISAGKFDSYDPQDTRAVLADLRRDIEYDNLSDEGLERILRGAVILRQKAPGMSMGQCLNQAMIWEFG